MKTKILAIALAVVLLTVTGYQTLAYFTSSDTAKNVITADTLTNIRINEYQGTSTTPVAEGTNGITITANDVVPSQTVSKIPKVQNTTGNASAWIRVRVTITCLASNGTTTLSATPINLDYNTTAWTLGSDGYYYYNNILPAATETSALFTGVTFNATMDNTYQGAAVTIQLDAQAVQSDNNGTSVMTAAGWPAF